MHASNARVLADVYSLGFHPVVTEESREGWEAYSKLNRNSYEEAYYSEIFQLGIERPNDAFVFEGHGNEGCFSDQFIQSGEHRR